MKKPHNYAFLASTNAYERQSLLMIINEMKYNFPMNGIKPILPEMDEKPANGRIANEDLKLSYTLHLLGEEFSEVEKALQELIIFESKVVIEILLLVH